MNSNTSNSSKLAIAIALVAAFVSSNAVAADITQMVSGGNTLVLALAKFLTSVAALTGGWFVVSGVIAWKKSSDDHGGRQVDFKSIVIPIVAGTILVSFTGFLLLTSGTFGFANPNSGSF